MAYYTKYNCPGTYGREDENPYKERSRQSPGLRTYQVLGINVFQQHRHCVQPNIEARDTGARVKTQGVRVVMKMSAEVCTLSKAMYTWTNKVIRFSLFSSHSRCEIKRAAGEKSSSFAGILRHRARISHRHLPLFVLFSLCFSTSNCLKS